MESLYEVFNDVFRSAVDSEEDSAASTASQNPRDASVILNMLFWNLVALILLLLYLLVIRTACPRFVLLRRVRFRNNESTSERQNDTETSCKRFFLAIKRVLIDPIRLIFVLDEHQLIHHCGMDGYVTIRTLRFCFKTVLVLCAFNLVVLTPTYRYQEQPTQCVEYCATSSDANQTNAYEAQCVCGWIDTCSMANIPSTSGTLWLPAVFMLLTTIFILVHAEYEYRQLVQVRRDYWRSHCPNQLHSVFVEYFHPPPTTSTSTAVHHAPSSMSKQTTKPSTIAEHLRRLFPKETYRIELFTTVPVQLLKNLGGVAHNRIRALMRLERAITLQRRRDQAPRKCRCILPCRRNAVNAEETLEDIEQQGSDIGVGKGKTCWRYCCCFGWVERVDAAEYYAARLDELNTHFKRLKQELEEYYQDPASHGSRHKRETYQFAFVSFRDAQSTAKAAQTLLHNDMSVRTAPDPNDIRWGSLLKEVNRTDVVTVLRTVLSLLLFIAILVFWGSLTTFIAAVTSLDAISQQIPALHDYLLANPNAYVWLQRLVALVYSIIVSLASPLIQLSVQIETHRIAESQVDMEMMRRYLAFLVIQVFVFYSIAGSVFKSIVEIATNPAQIVNTLSATIPQNASFFIMYIAVQTFWKMVDLVRVYSLLYELLRWIAYGRTVTRRESTYQACGCCWYFLFPSPMGISGTNANNLLIFFITMCYSVIQPFVSLAALFYFIFANISYTLQFIHASRQLRDGGGQFWPHSFWSIVAGLYTAQLTLVGTLLIKQGYYQAAFVALTCCLTTFFSSSTIHRQYHHRFTSMTLDLAADLDGVPEMQPLVAHNDKTDNETAPDNKTAPESKFVDTLCEPIMQYNHVLGNFDQEDDSQSEETGQEERSKSIRIYRYAHPVLYERDDVRPDMTLIDWSSSSRTASAALGNRPFPFLHTTNTINDETISRDDTIDSKQGGGDESRSQSSQQQVQPQSNENRKQQRASAEEEHEMDDDSGIPPPRSLSEP